MLYIQTPDNVVETGGKKKRKRANASCPILAYPTILDMEGWKFFENNSSSILQE